MYRKNSNVCEIDHTNNDHYYYYYYYYYYYLFLDINRSVDCLAPKNFSIKLVFQSFDFELT